MMDHLAPSPLLAAEQLNPDCIAELNSQKGVGLNTSVAWTDLEIIFASPPLNRRGHLSVVKERFVACAAEKDAAAAYRAGLVLRCWPQFEARATRGYVSSLARVALWCDLAEYTTQIPFTTSEVAREAYHQALTHTLAVSRHVYLFPGSVREYNSHDSYCFPLWPQSYTKIPVRARGRASTGWAMEREPDDEVIVFYLRDSIAVAAKRTPDIMPDVDFDSFKMRGAPQVPKLIADKLLAYAGDLALRQARDEELTQPESRFMRQLTEGLVKKLTSKGRQIVAQWGV